jgi:hypothetical protein
MRWYAEENGRFKFVPPVLVINHLVVCGQPQVYFELAAEDMRTSSNFTFTTKRPEPHALIFLRHGEELV